MIQKLRNRWSDPGGYSEVLKIAFPLILSTGSISLQHFIDRVFLTWYSPDAIAASMPSGLMFWTIVSLFMGTAAYVSTFVAQYFGAKRYNRIGPAVWQGLYLSIIAALVAIIFLPVSNYLFAFVGHDPSVQKLELIYFKILLISAPFIVIANSATGFFSGLGKTWIVLWVNVAGTIINLTLDYLMIFGYFGFPEMGMAGAGWATTIAAIFTAILFIVLMIKPQYNREYCTLSGWRLDIPLLRRLIRYGAPNGLQYFLEIIAFTGFIFIIGKLGNIELAASNIAFNINMLAFMPMFGMTLAVTILVGQRLGENNPDIAEKSTWSAFHLAFGFFGILGFSYYVFPGLFIWPFAVQASGGDFMPIHLLTATLLKFVAFYCLVDAGNMVFSGALKGAGDTRFVAVATIALSWGVMMIPSIILWYIGGSIYWFWLTVSLYVTSLCFIFWRRFIKGGWKSMRVIEQGNLGDLPGKETIKVTEGEFIKI